MGALSFLASFADTFRTAVYGPDVLKPRRLPDNHIPTDSALADALGLQRIEIVQSPAVGVKAHTRRPRANPKREALHLALKGGAK